MVALLRGINVGGKNRVEMARLRTTFERSGLVSVVTYINSGNVIFADPHPSRDDLAGHLEQAILDDFGFEVKVLVRDLATIDSVVAKIPATWVTGPEMRCDVLFLWDVVDTPHVVEHLDFNPEIEDVFYVAGAVVWRVDRANVTRSRLNRIVGTDFYKQVTIRNSNTVRRIQSLMGELEAATPRPPS